MTVVTTSDQTINTIQVDVGRELRDTGPRRALQAELAAVRNEIRYFNSNDEISREIDIWERNFTEALNVPNINAAAVLQAYIYLLQQILTDTITDTPLDDKALLGTDGRTYGYKHLCIHLNKVSEHYRNRSPINPDSKDKFSTKEHLLASYMIGWLARHNAKIESEEINRAFENLKPDQVQLIIPNEKNDRIRRVVEMQLQKDKEALRYESLRRDIQQQHIVLLDRLFIPFYERIQGFNTEVQGRLANIAERDTQECDQINKKLEQLAEEIRGDQEKIETLDARISYLGDEISEAGRNDLIIQRRIIEVDKAIKERKKNKWGTILKCVGMAAVCCVATWALSAALSSTALKAGILPMQGGAKLMGTYTF